MKKYKKSIILLLALVMISSILAGCSGKETAEEKPEAVEESPVAEETSTKPLEGEHLVYALNATFPPFESVEVVDGETKFVGMDLELVEKLSEKLGFTYEITDMAFAGLVGALQSDRADFVCSGISPTEERLKNVDFSVSYYYPGIAVVSKKDNPYENIEELKGKDILVGFGTTYESWANSNIEDANVKSMDGTPAVVQELINSRGDAAILDANQAAEFAKENESLEFHVLEYDESRENSFAIGFPKGSELTEIFNKELEAMLENGEIDELVIKWCGEEFAQ